MTNEDEDEAVSLYWRDKEREEARLRREEADRVALGEGTTLGNALEAFLAAPGQLFLRRREWSEGLVLEPAITSPGLDVLRNVLGPWRGPKLGNGAVAPLWAGEASPYHLTLQDSFAVDWVVVGR